MDFGLKLLSIDRDYVDPRGYFIQEIVDHFHGALKSQFELAVRRGQKSGGFGFSLRNNGLYTVKNLEQLATISLGEGFTDSFTEAVFAKVTEKVNKPLVFYDPDVRSSEILRKLYKKGKINLLSSYTKRDFSDLDANFYGPYFMKPGLRLSEELFSLFLQAIRDSHCFSYTDDEDNVHHVEYEDVDQEGYSDLYTRFAVSVAWNPDFFFRVIAIHPYSPLARCKNRSCVKLHNSDEKAAFPRDFDYISHPGCKIGYCTSFYVDMVHRLSEKPEHVSKETLARYITYVPWYRVEKISFVVAEQLQFGPEELFDEELLQEDAINGLLFASGFYKRLANFVYRYLSKCMWKYKNRPGDIEDHPFLRICSGVPEPLFESILFLCVQQVVGPVKMVNGTFSALIS